MFKAKTMPLSLYDPRRRRVGDTPALLGRHNWIVPRLTIWPDEETSLVRVSAMIPADGESAGYLAREVSNSIPAEEIPAILTQFRADPEGFLETFFNLSFASRETPPLCGAGQERQEVGI